MTWAPDVHRLLAALEDFSDLHAAATRRFGHRIIDLSFPNPRFLTASGPWQALADTAARMGPHELRYSPFGGFTPVRRAVAATLTGDHGLNYTWRHVIMTPGAAAALNVALQTLFRPPDRVMLVVPCWMDYPLYLAHLRLGCDVVRSTEDKLLDPDAVERAWTPQTRGLIIAQPSSPTGVIHTRSQLEALAEALHRRARAHGHAPILISDEAHRTQVWSTAACPPPAAVYPETITVHSFGKAWEMQGQRIGYLAVSPNFRTVADPVRRLEQALRLTGHCAPNALMQHLAATLADVEQPLTTLAALQRHARDRLGLMGFDVADGGATRFVYTRCPTPDDFAFIKSVADKGVLVMPSTLFHEPGWFRLALNVEQDHLDRALTIIGEVACNHV